jgi:hypothetical protein
MRLLLGSVFTLLLAAIVGLGTTWLTITHGIAFGSLTVGAWTAWPRNGSPDIDPYAHAIIARNGELPIGIGDGVAFYARTDDHGHPLDGRCAFMVTGMTPPARYWTVTLYDLRGRLVANTLSRYGFTSAEIVRDAGGRFTIAVAPLARPGNWLPTGGIERYVLMWRLYDTPIGMENTTVQQGPMPAITRKGCS